MVSGADIVASWRDPRESVAGIDTSYLVSAVLAVQVGDAVTTYVGIYGVGLAEANPFMAAILHRVGILGLVAVKCCWFGVAILGALSVDDSRRMLKYCFLVYLPIGGLALAINITVIGFLLLAA